MFLVDFQAAGNTPRIALGWKDTPQPRGKDAVKRVEGRIWREGTPPSVIVGYSPLPPGFHNIPAYSTPLQSRLLQFYRLVQQTEKKKKKQAKRTRPEMSWTTMWLVMTKDTKSTYSPEDKSSTHRAIYLSRSAAPTTLPTLALPAAPLLPPAKRVPMKQVQAHQINLILSLVEKIIAGGGATESSLSSTFFGVETSSLLMFFSPLSPDPCD